jgi:hypothetical protein
MFLRDFQAPFLNRAGTQRARFGRDSRGLTSVCVVFTSTRASGTVRFCARATCGAEEIGAAGVPARFDPTPATDAPRRSLSRSVRDTSHFPLVSAHPAFMSDGPGGSSEELESQSTATIGGGNLEPRAAIGKKRDEID